MKAAPLAMPKHRRWARSMRHQPRRPEQCPAHVEGISAVPAAFQKLRYEVIDLL